MYRPLMLILGLGLVFGSEIGQAQANSPRRLPAGNVVELNAPFACSWNQRQGRYLLVRLRRYGINRRGNPFAIVRNVPRRNIRERRQRRNRLQRRVARLSQRLQQNPDSPRIANRLQRVENRLNRVRRVPDLADRCNSLAGPPRALDACINSDIPQTITFIPGVPRTASLSTSANCEGEIYYEVMNESSGVQISASENQLSVFSDLNHAFEIDLRKCLTLTDGSWSCLNEQTVTLSPCSLNSVEQEVVLSDGLTQELELFVDQSCDNQSVVSITQPPTNSEIVQIENSIVTIQTTFSLGQDSFKYQVCNESHNSCGEASEIKLLVQQGDDFLGDPESLAPYRQHISTNERKHLVWKLGLNSVEILAGEGATLPLDAFISQRLLKSDWLPESTAHELERLAQVGFTFPVASLQDPFILDLPDLSEAGAPTAGSYIPLFRESEPFDSSQEIELGAERFLSVTARSFHSGLNRYFWGFPQAGGYTLFRARYLQPAAGNMLHFLLGHFGTSGSTITGGQEHWVGDYLYLLNRNSLGNYRELIRGTSDSGCADQFEPGQYGLGQGMVCNTLSNFWLDNQSNTATSPNENFAREFMELYVLGIDDQVSGMQNYTDITDVDAATHFMSGIRANSQVPVWKRLYGFDQSRHSTKPKTIFGELAPYYPQLALEDATLTPAEFTDHLFDHHPGASRYIARKVFSMMVYPDPSDIIVEELGNYFKNVNYDLKKLLQKIARSEAMFSARAANRGCVSSPFQSFARTINGLQLSLTSHRSGVSGACSNERACQQAFFNSLDENLSRAGESLLNFPDVFGYDYCGEDQGKDGSGAWLTSANLLSRTTSMISFIASHNRFVAKRTDPAVITRFHQLRHLIDPSGQYEQIQPSDVIAFYQDRFALKLDSSEYDLLYEYLTHSWNSGAPVPVEWNPESQTFMEHKLAGLTAIVAGMAQVNMH